MGFAKCIGMGKKIAKRPIRSAQTPATVAMLYAMEDRLTDKMEAGLQGVKSEIHGLRSEFHDMKSEIHAIKSEIHEVKSEVQGLKSEIHGVKSEVHGLKSEIHGVKSELHRVALLVEEQNARNKYVMDGYAQLYEMVEKIAKRA